MLKKIAIGLFVVLGILVYLNSASAVDVTEVSAQKWLNAENFTLAANKDKVVVLEFWATWCPPCRASIPHLREMSEKYKDKGVVFVSLTNETEIDKLEKFCVANNMNWVIGLGSNTINSYGVTGIPHAFIIADNEVKWHGHPMDSMDKKIESILASRADKK